MHAIQYNASIINSCQHNQLLTYPLIPWAVQRSFPSVVQSTSAINCVSESANASISLSQSGFIFCIVHMKERKG